MIVLDPNEGIGGRRDRRGLSAWVGLAGLYNGDWISGPGGGTSGGLLQEDAADPIRWYYNMTSRICVDRKIKQMISARESETERGTYVLADNGTTEINEAKKNKRNSLADCEPGARLTDHDNLDKTYRPSGR